MLERVLGTAVKVSALRVLVLNAGESFSLNQLASESGCSASTLHQQVGDLLGVIATRDEGGISVLERSVLFPPLKRLFMAEQRLHEGASIFDALQTLGVYYVTGSSALYLRGLGRDFAPDIAKYLFVCGRRVVKSRGGLQSGFPELQFHVVEDKIRPEDFEEIEVPMSRGGIMRRLPVAVPEKAIADSVWRMSEEGPDVATAVYVILEKVVDLERIKEYAVEKGAKVEGRLLWVLNEINLESRGSIFNLSGLHASSKDIPQRIRDEIRGSISRVLGS